MAAKIALSRQLMRLKRLPLQLIITRL